MKQQQDETPQNVSVQAWIWSCGSRLSPNKPQHESFSKLLDLIDVLWICDSSLDLWVQSDPLILQQRALQRQDKDQRLSGSYM
ncbi:hypothetical protein EYF80_040992 [Liparis tanakae]|uniref:Uncharacterized protein n=1 Tax=Liparis tanakae TaxID=230148 RepID=A0A4Z2G5F9_9TELE|nr:hypothetical protein EYF80_040992 [Liparis tanakae]